MFLFEHQRHLETQTWTKWITCMSDYIFATNVRYLFDLNDLNALKIDHMPTKKIKDLNRLTFEFMED